MVFAYLIIFITFVRSTSRFPRYSPILSSKTLSFNLTNILIWFFIHVNKNIHARTRSIFGGLANSAVTNNLMGSVITAANVVQIPGLNTLVVLTQSSLANSMWDSSLQQTIWFITRRTMSIPWNSATLFTSTPLVTDQGLPIWNQRSQENEKQASPQPNLNQTIALGHMNIYVLKECLVMIGVELLWIQSKKKKVTPFTYIKKIIGIYTLSRWFFCLQLIISSMVFVNLFIFVAFWGLVASDPDHLQDFCVADKTSRINVNGYPCKNAVNVTEVDFFFGGLANSAVINNLVGSVITAANVEKIPGLNTLGDIFVFPEGLVHYQKNNGVKPASVISGFNSQFSGTQSIAITLFTSTPLVPDHVLTKGFQIGTKGVKKMRNKLAPKKNETLGLY
ncbi:hypothetical protein CXB51_030443 [Gossypium anomalum]|uniref:Cupin type-1 domain-containing protein n=1 Tax=Gossypium anomalum TaxID=47600 RepID=A0A8J6CNP6_9ROSI|nr:hypothetical protein CXB51_030443 [Gossypium anomalum]